MNPNSIIDVEGLCHSYADGRASLRDVSFAVSPGECVGLVGANGAGKTTLFLLLAGILKPTSGAVRVVGLNPFASADRRQLPMKLGIVFQNSDDQIFHATVGDDVAFGPLNAGLCEEEVLVRVATSLRQVGLVGMENRSPLKLSEGEKRKVALAGILAMQPEVILFDEPSVFLDARGRRSLVDTICGLVQTRLIASHDMELIGNTCDRVLLMDEGRLITAGTIREILANRVLLEKHGVL